MRELWKVLSYIYDIHYIPIYIYILLYVISYLSRWAEGFTVWLVRVLMFRKDETFWLRRWKVAFSHLCIFCSVSLFRRRWVTLCRGTVMWPHTLPDCFRQEDRAGLLVSTHTQAALPWATSHLCSGEHRSTPTSRLAQRDQLICGFLDPFKTRRKLWTC